MLEPFDAPVVPPMEPPGDPIRSLGPDGEPSPAPPTEAAPAAPPVRPAPTWWVNAKGTPMTRHVAHKHKPTKTACNLSLSRMREADPDERMRLGVCAFCAPAGKAATKKKVRR